MSSFFTNKSLAAEDLYTKYAFFIPTDVYQNNTEVKSIKKTTKSNTKTTKTKTTPKTTHPSLSQKASSQTQRASNTQSQKTLPYVPQKLKPATSKTATSPTAKPKPKPQNKYELDDNIIKEKPVIAQTKDLNDDTEEISKQEKYATQSIESLLLEIPYPDEKLPRFKQIYNTYTLELRTLNRRGSLPYNLEQENILKKLNTISRLDVE
jgi:hypothetical protein